MTDFGQHAGPPLGVGEIVRESFRLLFARLGPIVAIGFFISLVTLVLTWILAGPEAIVGPPQAEVDILADGTPPDPMAMMPDINVAGLLVSGLFQMFAYGLTIAALVLLALDARTGRERPARDYLVGAVPFILPVLVLSFVVAVVVAIGFALFVVPGLWLYAVFAVFIPAIVLEGAGFGALGRSAELTREYRWSIVGLGFVLVAILIAVMLVVGIVVGIPLTLVGPEPGARPGPVFVGLTVLVNAFGAAIGNGFGAIVATLIYARLREIKEGVRLPDLAGGR